MGIYGSRIYAIFMIDIECFMVHNLLTSNLYEILVISNRELNLLS